jgi:glycosyltransferase involved in cell wall biosynthesis
MTWSAAADYGFERRRLEGRARAPGEPFIFGYLGRHTPAKGIQQLLAAFRGVRGNARLRVWGRPEGRVTEALRALAAGDARVEWRPEVANEDVVREVLNHCDALVVPSIWCAS